MLVCSLWVFFVLGVYGTIWIIETPFQLARRTRVGQPKDYGEQQSVGGNVKIEIGEAVQKDRHQTPERSKLYCPVKRILADLETPDAFQHHPEKRTKEQKCCGQTEFGCKFQIVVVSMANEIGWKGVLD